MIAKGGLERQACTSLFQRRRMTWCCIQKQRTRSRTNPPGCAGGLAVQHTGLCSAWCRIQTPRHPEGQTAYPYLVRGRVGGVAGRLVAVQHAAIAQGGGQGRRVQRQGQTQHLKRGGGVGTLRRRDPEGGLRPEWPLRNQEVLQSWFAESRVQQSEGGAGAARRIRIIPGRPILSQRTSHWVRNHSVNLSGIMVRRYDI
jgi:hypothetical protein